MKTLFSIVPNLETHYHLKLEFKKWTNIQEASDYIHGTKHRKDNYVITVELPCRIPY